MLEPVSPSYIVRSSLNLEPIGTPSTEEAQCCMCGIHIRPPMLVNKASFSGGFTDDLSLVKRGKDTKVCGDCQALCTVDGLRNSGFGAFSASGYLPFRKWVDVAFALLNPPPAPFVMCYATAKSQHMAWRSPVNYSPESFRVRVGLVDLHIRRQRLLDAPAICERIAKAAFASFSAKKKQGPAKKTLPHPFVSLSPDLKDPNQGLLHPMAKRLEQQETPPYAEFASDMQWVRSLTKGEIWALRFVLTPDAGSSSTNELTD